MNKERKTKILDSISICVAVIFAVGILFFVAVGIFQTYKEVSEDTTKSTYNEANNETDDNDIQSDTSTTNDNHPEDATTTNSNIFKDIVYIEAGTTEILPTDLFRDYKEQSYIIKNPLTDSQLKKSGASYELEIICGGHSYKVAIEIKDTTPPTIEGLKDIYVCLGDTIAYRKNMVLVDNSDDNITVVIDNKKVDVNVVGDYPVRYEAFDIAGNSATADIMVHVTENPVINEDYMEPYIKNIVDSVIKDEMTTMEKAYALYRWCRNNINYLYTSTDRSSIWQGAYDGICVGMGDCFVYYATYEVLLTYAGIENMCVTRVSDTSNHWWNLVKIDEGWYHCDASPRTRGDTYRCFMQTDEQVAAYTASNKNKPDYYTFDKSLYPERGTVVVYE